MNPRKMLPLALLYATDGHQIEGRTRFQKLIFLMQQENGLEDLGPTESYLFEPYDYGPFSSALYDDLDEHIEHGLIDESKERIDEEEEIVKFDYHLESEGEEFIEELLANSKFNEVLDQAETIARKYGDIPLPQLINLVYSEYPEYAENSVLR